MSAPVQHGTHALAEVNEPDMRGSIVVEPAELVAIIELARARAQGGMRVRPEDGILHAELSIVAENSANVPDLAGEARSALARQSTRYWAYGLEPSRLASAQSLPLTWR